jgi:lipopolysaccharide export system permease protein
LLFISYYLVTVIGEKIAREGVWKIEQVVWMPTFFYLIFGIVLTHQAVTDSLLLSKETYSRIINSINIFKWILPSNWKKTK